MLSTRIEETARKLGYRVKNVDADADFDSAIAAGKPALVIVTFEQDGEAWERLITAARRAGIKVVAFGRHTNVQGFRRAKELGADQVVANSQIATELPGVLDKRTGSDLR